MSEKEKGSEKGEEKKREFVRKSGRTSLKDVQKQQLEKLMEEPDKLIDIPDKPKDWKPPEPPEFVRFYMGSSAGAGSEVFHVYRHLRRFEMTRQQWIDETAKTEDEDTAFLMRLAEKKVEAEEKTAKKRAKRLKKKAKQKLKDSDSKPPDEKKPKVDHQEQQVDEHEEDLENPFVIGGR